MIVQVKVVAGSKLTSIEKEGPNAFRVRLKAHREKGAANKELIQTLARHFNVRQSQIKIKFGHRSSTKLIEIALTE
ncbi:MAG: hypothetical protein A3F09_04700 [Chlamydiae bacterium RIFCSPHIGHO2_12_FULL_49_11]|nr:MAG: hypothetical protein A3F09_04700 [Chlamydiae bacterium RIFCSPHIGHO2_12_FULL_49_11]